jgi:hypothetical protein
LTSLLELPNVVSRPRWAINLTETLRGLAADDRDVFLLKEIGGLSYAEIASEFRGRPAVTLGDRSENPVGAADAGESLSPSGKSSPRPA